MTSKKTPFIEHIKTNQSLMVLGQRQLEPTIRSLRDLSKFFKSTGTSYVLIDLVVEISPRTCTLKRFRECHFGDTYIVNLDDGMCQLL